MKTPLKASLIAVAIASMPIGVNAAGLGQINVFSGLGQPLRAEIQLSASPQELQSLSARVASPEAFRQANVPYSAVMPALKLSVESRGNRSVVRVSSDRPVNDPFVDLLVELNWASGRLLREYTFLLDPVDVAAPQPLAARVETPAAVPAPAPRPAAPAAPVAGGGSYRVMRGDTLRSIAEAHKPQDVSLDQMLMAMFRENPTAFEDANINRLRAGAILRIPDEAAAKSIGPAEARREVVAQAADFNAYRRRLAGTVATRPAEEQAPGSQAAAGTIVPKVEQRGADAPSGDQVRVSRGAAAGADGGSARLQALEEELAARDKALADANDRLVELERSIRDLQQLIELKSQDLARLQQQSGGTPQTDAAAASAAPAPAAPVAAAEAPAAAPPAEAPKPAPKPKPKPAPKPAPAPEPEEGFLDYLLGQPLLLAGGGGLLALLLGYAGFRMRRQRQAKTDTASMAPMSDFPTDSGSVFGGTGGQSVDTSNSSVIHTDFSQSGLAAIDADEGVDPVAEADVYMAYGRDAQAEEILLDALKADPSRTAVYLKLLEIYAERKSLKEFEATATDLYSRTGGQGSDWEKAATMGRALDPQNPLYRQEAASRQGGEALTEPPVAGAAVAGLAAATAAAAVMEAPAEAEGRGETALGDLDFTTSALAGAGSGAGVKDTWTAPGELESFVRGTPPETELGRGGESGGQAGADNEPAAEVDPNSLDFDLGDLSLPALDAGNAGSGVSEPEAAATLDLSSPAEADVLDLDLDLDLGLGEARADEPVQVAELPSAVAQDSPAGADDLLGGLDFETAGKGQDFAMTEVEAPGVAAAAAEEAAMDLEKTTINSELLDFDFDLDAEATEPPQDAVAGLDLTSINLDLEPIMDEAPEEQTLPPGTPFDAQERGAAPAAFEPAAAEGDEELRREVDTKLELARAYEEMGDKEGARELLDEVLREGTSAQRDSASKLLERLA